jgi:hypothetical protein
MLSSSGGPTPATVIDSRSSSATRAAANQGSSRSTKKRRVEKDQGKKGQDSDNEEGSAEKPDDPNGEGPMFKKFKCKWRNCAAELHNFDNLQRHVSKAHKKQMPYGAFPCHWAGCNKPATEEQKRIMARKDGTPEYIPLDFKTADGWWTHVSRHLEEVKESMGLGPAALPSGLSTLCPHISLHRLTDFILMWYQTRNLYLT